jgi:hypothetical protein
MGKVYLSSLTGSIYSIYNLQFDIIFVNIQFYDFETDYERDALINYF